MKQKDPIEEILDSNTLDFAVREAQWLDSRLHDMLPGFVIEMANLYAHSWKGRLAMVAIGVVLAVKRVRVERQTHYGIKTGKGFRPNSNIQTVEAVTTRIVRAGKLFAEKRFELGFIIPNK